VRKAIQERCRSGCGGGALIHWRVSERLRIRRAAAGKGKNGGEAGGASGSGERLCVRRAAAAKGRKQRRGRGGASGLWRGEWSRLTRSGRAGQLCSLKLP
jgi:hypothetical protein